MYATVPDDALPVIQKAHEFSQRDQFLMKLRYEFESVWSNLISRHPSPSPDPCLNELLQEELQCTTQATLGQLKNALGTVTYATQGKPQGRYMS